MTTRTNPPTIVATPAAIADVALLHCEWRDRPAAWKRPGGLSVLVDPSRAGPERRAAAGIGG
jgi:hypothetical protein